MYLKWASFDLFNCIEEYLPLSSFPSLLTSSSLLQSELLSSEKTYWKVMVGVPDVL